MPEKRSQESWKNASKGKAAVLKYDRFNKLIHEIVSAGKQINLTKEEREINQERAASSGLDIFSNGVLVPNPASLLPEDAQEFASNPNLMSEGDLASLFKLTPKNFEAKLNEITNPYTLGRLKEIADDETETIKVSTRQGKLINDRIEAIQPERKKMKSLADEPWQV